MEPLSFSVIVATRNRGWDVARMVESIEATGTESVAEILLADDASDTPLPAIESRIPVRVLRSEEHRGAAVMRNLAAHEATGDVLAFLDDDARVFPDWFDVAGRALTSAQAITGRIVPMDDGWVSRARQWRYEERYRTLQHGQATTFFAGGNSAVHTEAFLLAGGFPDIASGADNLLVQGLEVQGYQVRWTPELRILHRNSKGVRKAAVEAWRSGTGRPGTPAAAVREVRRAVGAAPWRRDPASAVLNAGLQVLHSTSRCLPKGTRS